MRHPDFQTCVLLASNGVAASIDQAAGWSSIRREAALIALGESRGGRWNMDSWSMHWPEAKP